MHVVAVDSADDPRLGDFTGLTDVAARRVREPEEGMFIAESALVIERAVSAGYRPRSLLTSPKWLDQLEGQPGLEDVTVYVATEDVLRAVTGYRVHRGALASMTRRALPDLPGMLSVLDRVVILEDIVDHTNVGAIFRNAAALGVQGVIVSPRCADPLYRRSVRVSMGSVFALPWTRATCWPDDLDVIKEKGFALWALTPDPDSVTLDQVRSSASVVGVDPAIGTSSPKWALMFGTEGAGLSSEALARADARVRIPMHSGVDSLNVAAAAAVAFYALSPDR